MADIQEARKPRQAVVLIHGIGEQRPMETLRAFVKALVEGDFTANAPHETDSTGPKSASSNPRLYYSKPDRLSGSYELRRLKLHRVEPRKVARLPEGLNVDWPETDFYEYYWAHQMYGTTISHVLSWAWRLPLRGLLFLFGEEASKYPQTRRVARIAWLCLIGAVILGALGWSLLGARTTQWWAHSMPTQVVAFSAIAALVLSSAWGLLKGPLSKTVIGTVADFIGDAARYFDVTPKNVARRYDILRGGIALLKDLHEDRDETSDKVLYRYGRVVLVGHSLGSVIAYDLIRHYWALVNGRLGIEDMTEQIAELEALRSSKDNSRTFVDADRRKFCDVYQCWQRSAFAAMNCRLPSGEALPRKEVLPGKNADPRINTPARWIVSDLVTLGSPLAHAPMLLANGIESENGGLRQKIELRELPTCPPDRSRTLNPGRFVVPLSAEAEMLGDDRNILHHAACYAVTLWTNLWFRNDWIGGSLLEPFGNGIADHELKRPAWNPFTAHTSYWDGERGKESIARIGAILRRGVAVAEKVHVE